MLIEPCGWTVTRAGLTSVTAALVLASFCEMLASIQYAGQGATVYIDPSLEVAVRYSASPNSVLLRLQTRSFKERGAFLGYLSCFPAESEILFAPLTFLQVTGEANPHHVQFWLDFKKQYAKDPDFACHTPLHSDD